MKSKSLRLRTARSRYMDIVTIIVGGLITWRLSYMLAHEMGPVAIFEILRAKLAKNQQQRGGLFDLISCMTCLSIYIGAVTALFVATDDFQVIAYAISFSAITMLVERLTASKS